MHDELAAAVTPELLAEILADVPDAWLAPDDRPDPKAPPDAAAARERYASS